MCDEYVALKETIDAVAGHSNTSDKLDALLQNGILIPAAFAVMNKAVGYYATGSATCDPHYQSDEEWIAVTLEFGTLRELSQQAAYHFFGKSVRYLGP